MTRPRKRPQRPAGRRWEGSEKLEPLLVPLADVALDPRNAREHPERNLRAIRHSLDAHGQLTPIIVGNHSGAVVRGNGTLLALRLEPAWSHVAAIQGRFKTPAQERAYALADNRTAELAEWDFEQLSVDMRELQEGGFELEPLGWESWEYEPLLAADWAPPEHTELPHDAAHVVNFTPEQWAVVGAAVDRVRARAAPEQVGVADALRVVCEEWSAR